MHETPRAPLAAYGVAVLATAVSLLVRWLLWPALGDAVPHMFFFPAVMIAAYYGGFGPGFLSTLLGAVAANYFFTEPHYSLQIKGLNAAVALPLFVAVGAIISGLCESLHRARRRLVAEERRRAEEASRETEERFRQLAENIHEIFWMREVRQERVLYVSPGYEEVWGKTCQSLYEQPRSWAESIHPDDRDRAIERMEQHRRGVTTDSEFRVVRPDGSVRWIRSRAFPVKDQNGDISRVAGLAEDITERKQTEEALVQERYLLHTLMDNLPDNMYFKDAASRFVRINTALTAYFGLSDSAQAIGKTDFDFFTAEHARPAYADEQEIIRTGQPVVGKEEKETWLDGRVRWVSTTKMPFRDKDGKIIGTFGVGRDITRFKLTEEALRESEQRFRTFVDHATDAFFLQDERHVILDVNRQACESLRYTRDELLGMTPTDLDPDVTLADLEVIQRELNAGKIMAFESRHRRKDGTIFPVEIRGQAFWEGGRRFTVALVRDVTDRKRAEEALRESERRWRGLTEALPQLVWSAEPDGTCDYFSRQWTEHTGVAESDLLGWRWLEVLHPDDRERTRRFWLDSVAGRGPYDVEYRVRRSDGVYRWFKTRGTPIRDDAGDVCEWFGSCTDITDLRLIEEALRQAKDAAEAANRAKDEFLANVSHEIRTPMNAILGMTELALDTPLTDDQRQFLRTVKLAADNLLDIINDLLDFSKIEAGKLELDPVDFSLRAGLADTLRVLAERAQRKGLELICHVHPEVPDALIGDAGRLRQVLLNLVDNAIKFTADGEVEVRVEVAGDPKDEADVSLRFAVRDTGIGIPEDRQEKIFRAFEQEDTSTTRKYGGTGLGLTIAARLVALMSGQITVDSVPGRGSTFAFTARFGRQSHPPVARGASGREPAPALVPAAAPLRILVAEDNEFNAQLLEQLLVRRGHSVRVARNGRDGLSLLGIRSLGAGIRNQESGDKYSLTPDSCPLTPDFDMLLLDVHMPELDGFQVVGAIRECERIAGGHLPVIALTARSRPQDRERCLAAGMDDFLAKPIQAANLWAAIDRIALAHPLAGRPGPDLLDPRVLLAACGDDAVILEKICQTFRSGLPDHVTAIQVALRDKDAPRLREAAHKLCGMVAAFSTVAGGVASDLEDHAALGELEEAHVLVGQIETMTRELMQSTQGLSLETLRHQASERIP